MLLQQLYHIKVLNHIKAKFQFKNDFYLLEGHHSQPYSSVTQHLRHEKKRKKEKETVEFYGISNATIEKLKMKNLMTRMEQVFSLVNKSTSLYVTHLHKTSHKSPNIKWQKITFYPKM